MMLKIIRTHSVRKLPTCQVNYIENSLIYAKIKLSIFVDNCLSSDGYS